MCVCREGYEIDFDKKKKNYSVIFEPVVCELGNNERHPDGLENEIGVLDAAKDSRYFSMAEKKSNESPLLFIYIIPYLPSHNALSRSGSAASRSSSRQNSLLIPCPFVYAVSIS